MKTGPAKPVRCALSTRVSTEQGLEQDLNSRGYGGYGGYSGYGGYGYPLAYRYG